MGHILLSILFFHLSHALEQSVQQKPFQSAIVFPSEDVEEPFGSGQSDWWRPVLNATSRPRWSPHPRTTIPIKMARLLTTFEGLRQLLNNPDQMESELIVMQRSSKLSPNANEPQTLSSRIGQKTLKPHNKNGELARPAGCQPLPVQIPLTDPDADSAADTTLWPSCTLVHRCSGCCNSQLMECQPKHTSNIHVMAVETRLKSGNNTTGLEYVGYKMIPLVEHTSCHCRCKQDANSCTEHQQFSELDCACQCSNVKEREKCSRLAGRMWDWRVCKCQCRRSVVCSSGHYFDYNQCKCRRLPDTRFNNDITSSFFRHFSSQFYNSNKNGLEKDAFSGVKEARHASPEQVGVGTVKVRGPQRSLRYNQRNRRE